MVIGGKHFGQYTYEHWFDDEYGNKNTMYVLLRPEEEKDYNAVESLTREAFWNVYKPGCDEHLLIHAISANLEVFEEFKAQCQQVKDFDQ